MRSLQKICTHPISSTDARGYTTSYGYDAAGNNLTSITPPAGAGLGSWAISPDALSRPATVTDGKGQTATYSYDPLDRVTATAHAPGGPTFGYGFDADGAQTTLTDPGGTTNYTVDDLFRLKREDFPGGAFNAYDYDAAGNLKTLTDAGGTTSYAYDGLNQLASVTEPGDATSTTFAYNSDGARTQIRYPSGVTVNTGYHVPSGRVTSATNKDLSDSVIKSFAYTYTLGARDTELAQTVTDQAANRTVNSYDALDRHTSAVTSGGPNPSRFVYTLDGEGNRTTQTYNRSASTGGTTETYAYDSASLPCWRALGTPASVCGSPPPSQVGIYTHDANANDLDNSHQRFAYNAANQATSVHVFQVGTTASLAYRGPGQSQPIRDGAYAPQSNLLGIGVRASAPTAAARANTASASAASPCAGGGLSALAAAPSTSYYARAADGTLLSQRTPSTSQRRNYLYDGEGSVAGLTDGDGTLTTSYRYEPYGHPENLTSLGDPNPFGYLGAYTAGVESDGVICGGPNNIDGGYYDAEDGRGTQRTGLLGEGYAELSFVSDVVDKVKDGADQVNEVAGDVQRKFDEYVRDPVRTRGGGVVRNCAIGAAIGGFLGSRFGGIKDGAILGCIVVNAGRRGR